MNAATFFIAQFKVASGDVMSALICEDAMAGRVMWVVTLWFNKGRLVLVVDKKKNKKTRI